MKFSISILAINGLAMTKRCVDSVLSGGGDFEILLTDNGSEDGTAAYFEQLAAADSRISVVHNPVNKGFGIPNNEALARAHGTYFVCLNNDAEVPQGWLDKLEQPFKDFPSAAISGPSGSCCSLRHDTGGFLGWPGRDFEYVEGSCLCIPVALARKYTLFAPYMIFAYGEDLDLSLRMRARGQTIHQVPFQIIHHRSQTARQVTFPTGVHEHNQRMLKDRWWNYLALRRFNLPIIIQRSAALGDVLLTTPLIRALKDQQPESEIYFHTNLPDVLRYNPYIKTIASTKQQFVPRIGQWARFINLDMAYENLVNTHIVDAYFQKALIIPSESDYRQLDNSFSADDMTIAKSWLVGERWVAIHPGPSTWRGKQWPTERFHQLCQTLIGQNWKVALVGNGDGPAYPCTLDLRNRVSLQQLAAVLRCCQLFIGLDSYPMHAAQSMGIPTIGLFGTTRPEYIMTGSTALALAGQAPCAGERHRTVGQTHIPCGGACIDSITLEQVLEKVEQVNGNS